MGEPLHHSLSTPEIRPGPETVAVRRPARRPRSLSTPSLTGTWHQDEHSRIAGPQFMDDHGPHPHIVRTATAADLDEDALAEEERDIYAVPSFISYPSSLLDPEKQLTHALSKEPTRANYEQDDPYLVTWNGENDKANPKNWSIGQKWAAVVCVSMFTFVSPVSSSMSSPALTQIGRDLQITESTELTLTMSIFIAGYALGPLLLAPLSEIYGRVPVLQLGNLFFLAWNIGCGFATSKVQLIIFRFLAGLGGSTPMALGGGVLADCFTADERGRAISIYSLMPLLGPAVGPVVGGFIAEYSKWRWCFWSVSLFTVFVQILGLFFLRETWAPKILAIKAAKLRRETGDNQWHTEWESPDWTLSTLLKTSLTRPFVLIVTQPIVQVLACYMAYLYGLMYLMLATFPSLWENTYGESVGIGGINYVSLGLGFFAGTQIGAPINDRLYRRLKKGNHGVGKPEFRVPLLIPSALFQPLGLFLYGWSAQYRVFWLVPNIGAFLFAVGTIMGFQALQTYIIDSYQKYAASAIGATTLLRSLAGFGFPLFARPMFNALGLGWGNSLLAFVGIGIGIPAPLLLWKYGETLRKRSQYAAG